MRSLVAGLLLVLLIPMVVAASAATWATRTVVDDVPFTNAVGRVLDTPGLQEAIATRATDVAVEILDRVPDRLTVVGRVVLDLPAGTTRTQIEDALHARILAALEDPTVREVRDATVTSVHRFVLDGARGRNDVVAVRDGMVVIDLGPLVERVAAVVDDRLPSAGLAEVDPAAARLVLVEAPALQTVAQAVALMDALRIVIPLAVGALVLLALMAARDRTRMLAYVGVALMIAGFASLAMGWLGGGLVEAAPTDPLVGSVARDVYAALLTPLMLQSALIVSAGALLAIVGWFLLHRRAARRPAARAVGAGPSWPAR
jgi:hypothetical protein